MVSSLELYLLITCMDFSERFLGYHDGEYKIMVSLVVTLSRLVDGQQHSERISCSCLRDKSPFFFILEWRKKVNQTIRSRISECRNLLAQSETKIPKLPIVHTNGVFTAHVCV
jgi:hypothetical protein